MPRKSTGKRLRFEVFQRDGFACQYCGAQPPTVVLVVDHIVPVAGGGESTIDNLITACEPCNQGKSDKQLEVRQVRPDADLLYLQTQQEIAELNALIADLEDTREQVQQKALFLRAGLERISRMAGLGDLPEYAIERKVARRG